MLGEKKALERAFFFNRSIFYLLISFSISTCFLWSVQSPLILSINNEVVAYVTISLLVLLFLRKDLIFKCDLIFYLFVGSLVLSLFNAQGDRYWGTKNLIYLIYAGNALIFYTVAASISDRDKIKEIFFNLLLIAIIIASVVSSFIVIYQWLGYANDDLITNIWIYPASGSRFSANLAQPNHLATLLSLGICALLYFSRNVKNIVIVSLLIFVFGFCIFLTYSRTSYVSLFFVSIYYSYIKKFEKKYTLLGFLPLISLLIISQTFSWWMYISPLSFESVGDRGLESGRYLLWSMAWEGLKDKYLLGYGPGNIIGMYKYVLPNHFDFAEGSVPSSSHNVVIDVALIFGVPFALIFSLVLIRIIIKAFHEKKESISGYAYLAIIPIITHSMLEYPENYAYFLLPFSLFIGLANPLRNSTQATKLKSVIFYVAYATISFFTIYSIFDFYSIENNFKKLRLQNLNVELSNPFTGSSNCFLKMYCDFLDAHLITEITPLNTVSENKNQYLINLSESLPTPKIMELSIFESINEEDYHRVKNEIINYCLFFGRNNCIYLENKIKNYDPEWGIYFPTQYLSDLRSKK